MELVSIKFKDQTIKVLEMILIQNKTTNVTGKSDIKKRRTHGTLKITLDLYYINHLTLTLSGNHTRKYKYTNPQSDTNDK